MRNLYHCFLWWFHQFAFPPAIHKCFLFSTFLPPILISCLFDDSYSYQVWSNWYSDCSFDLHFPDFAWLWAPFHIPVGHYMSLEEVPVPFLNQVLFFCDWVVWVFVLNINLFSYLFLQKYSPIPWISFVMWKCFNLT